jgi:quercetin dioxygenase-like cupin family protein
MAEPLMTDLEGAPVAELGGQVIAGSLTQGEGQSYLLALGEGTMLTYIKMQAGFENPGHTHPEHESVGYIISGKVEMRIGDQVHTLGPGTTWYHPKGVEHTSLAIEDSVVLEFHAPLRPDILELFDRPR